MPNDTIPEERLSEEQKKIVDLEKGRIDIDNFDRSWIGYKVNDGWNFMRHGLEVIYIEEPRGNIAREKLYSIIEEKYKK